MCVGGVVSCNLLAVIPGPLPKSMPIARHGTVGVATHHVPCSSHSDVQKTLAFKTKMVKSTFVNKSPAHSSGSHGFVHAKSHTRIGCWNVRTLGSLSKQSAQLRAVLDTMKSKNMDLLTLAESHRPGSGVSSVCDSTFLHSGSPSSHTHGVAVILSLRAKAVWDAAGCVFQPVSEHILRLRLKCHMSYMTVVAVYAPTIPPNSTSESVGPSEAFYDQLQSSLSSIPSSDLLVILGDFNAHVGSDFSSWISFIGPHGVGERNENGERLLDFCAGNLLIITNTWFQHKLLHKVTWFRNGNRSRTGYMIDHVLVNKCFDTNVLDTRVYRSTFHESDHELVVSTLCFKIKAKRRHTGTSHYQTTNISTSHQAGYQSVLAKSFDKFDQSSSINAQWNSFKLSIQKACKSLLPAPRGGDPDSITNEVCNLSKEKKEAWVRLKNTPPQYITRLKEEAHNAWWSDRAAEAEHRALVAEHQGRGGSLIWDLRVLGKKFSKPASSNLVAKDGRVLQSDGDKLNHWSEHFQEVVNCQIDIDVIPIEDLPIATPHSSSDTTL